MTIPAWTAIGAVLLGLVLLLALLLGLGRRLRPLKAAAARLQDQAKHVDELQKRLEQLQPAVDEAALKVEQVTAKLPHR